ncbi:MAG TPA: hypothetical protein VF988_02335, partial [Verrucomicrobiae bacterium]
MNLQNPCPRDLSHSTLPRTWRKSAGLAIVLALGTVVSTVLAAEMPTVIRFDFGGDKGVAGAIPISATNVYSSEAGYGFEPGANVTVANHAISSTHPFYFSVK